MTVPAAYLREFSEPVGFMDHAAVSPLPQRVRVALADTMAAMSAPPAPIGPSITGVYEASLATMARFVGASPEQVTVVPSTSAALFATAFGFIGVDGNVVFAAHEFPANQYPWMRAEALGGLAVRRVPVPDGRVTADALRDAVDSDTRVVTVSLVDFRTGFRVDVPAIRELVPDGILVVDAIQGLGAVAASLAPADVLASAGHKWMRAGFGSGVLAVSGRALDRISPALAGWWAVEDAFDFGTPPPHEERADAERFQLGAPAMFGALAFATAVEVIELAGITAIEATILDLVASIEDVLASAGAEVIAPWRTPAERAGIVSFRMPGIDPLDTHRRLLDVGISSTCYGRDVRLAPHASTDPDSVELLAEAL